MVRFIKSTASHLAARLCLYRGKDFFDAIERYCDAFHRKLNNVNFDMNSNGERRVLKIISSIQPKCVFDVGANKGEWSQLFSRMNPLCRIHAFEIVPSTYEELCQSTRGLDNVTNLNFGLGSVEDIISINLGDDSSMATGCKIEGMRFHDDYYVRKIQCKVRKASDYVRENNLASIDFVKIDTEGMDFQVIKGFEDLIKNVRIIQFEYGIFNISSHDLLADFCKHLTDNGFLVGKIFPRCVRFFEYNFNMENFHGSNYLAVRADETEIIERLQRYGT